jgi:hypothetical protein
MTHLDFVEKESQDFKKSPQLNNEKKPTFKIKIFKPPEFDTKLYDFYYYTDVYISR